MKAPASLVVLFGATAAAVACLQCEKVDVTWSLDCIRVRNDVHRYAGTAVVNGTMLPIPNANASCSSSEVQPSCGCCGHTGWPPCRCCSGSYTFVHNWTLSCSVLSNGNLNMTLVDWEYMSQDGFVLNRHAAAIAVGVWDAASKCANTTWSRRNATCCKAT